ncbi:MAG: NYN domain-containing protein [Clostridiales bacterium]|nr:NYN domain-containing protein [Clostridiales bacterium]
MPTKKYAVLADIESVRVPYSTFAAALEELSKYGEVAACKFYGYSAKRTKDYGEFIQENSYDALSALPRKRKGKLDLRQVIDAARLAQFPNIDGFFIIYGKGDITPLVAYLKAYGKDVIAGVIEDDKNSALCNKVIHLDLNAQVVANSSYTKVAPGAAAPQKAPVKRTPAPAAPAQAAPQQTPQQGGTTENHHYYIYNTEPQAQPQPQPVQQAPQQNADDAAQMALLLEQFNKIIIGNDD